MKCVYGQSRVCSLFPPFFSVLFSMQLMISSSVYLQHRVSGFSDVECALGQYGSVIPLPPRGFLSLALSPMQRPNSVLNVPPAGEQRRTCVHISVCLWRFNGKPHMGFFPNTM